MCFVAVLIQHEMSMRSILLYVFSGLAGSTVFSHITSQEKDFRRKNVTEHKMCVLISSTSFA
jgi:hypothetical protein